MINENNSETVLPVVTTSQSNNSIPKLMDIIITPPPLMSLAIPIRTGWLRHKRRHNTPICGNKPYKIIKKVTIVKTTYYC